MVIYLYTTVQYSISSQYNWLLGSTDGRRLRGYIQYVGNKKGRRRKKGKNEPGKERADRS